MTFIAQIVLTIHNAWLSLPAWLRTAIRDLIVALIAVGAAFAWTFPANWTDAYREVAAFWLLAVPVIVAIVKTEILPYIVAWFLRTFPVSIGPVAPARGGRWFLTRL